METKSKPWIVAALLTAICFAGITIIMKLLAQMGVPAKIIVGAMFGFASFFALPFFCREPRKVDRSGILVIALVGLLGYVANVFQVLSIDAAPNPGFTPAIIGTQACWVSLAAVILFASPLTLPKMCGLLMIVGGIVCLSI